MKNKPKNIPSPYKSKGTPIYRDTTALPFGKGGPVNPAGPVNTFEPALSESEMRAKIAYEAALGNTAAQRMLSLNPKTYDFGDGNFGTHYMASFGNYAVPTLQDTGKASLEYIENPPPGKEDFKFSTPEQAEYFAENYKTVSPMITQKYLDGGPLVDKTNHGDLLPSVYASALGNYYAQGGMIKRADGSYSPRGLWDNIRAAAAKNKAAGKSGKESSKEILAQAKKIEAEEKEMGGYLYGKGGQFPTPYSLPEDSFKQGGNNLHNSIYASSNAQYPGIYKYGGSFDMPRQQMYMPLDNVERYGGYQQNAKTFSAGGENHKVYMKTSPTGNGEGIQGHIMVNHPTKDKGQWDTIDLTEKAGAKTVAQGVAATKQWHAEHPNQYAQGGSILSMSNTPQLEGERKDLTYPDGAYVYDGGGNIKISPFSYHGDTPGLYRFSTHNPTFNINYSQPFGERVAKEQGFESFSGGLTARLPYKPNTKIGVEGNLRAIGRPNRSSTMTVETDLSGGWDPNVGPYANFIASPQFMFGNVSPTKSKVYGTGLHGGEYLGKVGPFIGASFTPRPQAFTEHVNTTTGGAEAVKNTPQAGGMPFGVKGSVDFGIGRKGIRAGLSGYAGADLMGMGLQRSDDKIGSSESMGSGLKPRFNYGAQANLTIPIKTAKTYAKKIIASEKNKEPIQNIEDSNFVKSFNHGGVIKTSHLFADGGPEKTITTVPTQEEYELAQASTKAIPYADKAIDLPEVTVTPRRQTVQLSGDLLDQAFQNEMLKKAEWERRSSGAAQPVDWVWTLPLGATRGTGAAVGEALSNVMATKLPGLPATLGQAVNAGFIGKGLYEAPSTIKTWEDVTKGKKDWKEAAEKTAWNLLDFTGAGEMKEGMELLSKDIKGLGNYFKPKTVAPVFQTSSLPSTVAPVNNFDIEELRRVFHNSERYLTPEESRFLSTQGRGEAINYVSAANRARNSSISPEEAQGLWAQYNTLRESGFKPKVKKIIKNKSGITKEEALTKLKDLDKEAIANMSEEEFASTYLKPSGELVSAYEGSLEPYFTGNQSVTALSAEEYANLFNERLDLLNDIIAQRNKSGVEYRVKGLTPEGTLEFYTPKQTVQRQMSPKRTAEYNEYLQDPEKFIVEKAGLRQNDKGKWVFNDEFNISSFKTKEEALEWAKADIENFIGPKFSDVEGTASWSVDIVPGQWRGEVQDIPSSNYYKSIPGLNMSLTTQSVFPDFRARRGSGAYESINEYLKKLDLGRVKPGFNSQTEFSRGAWENFINSGRGHGFYANPSTVYGSMKKNGGSIRTIKSSDLIR